MSSVFQVKISETNRGMVVSAFEIDHKIYRCLDAQ